MPSTITILLPTYNGAKYLAEQLDSIVDQTVTPTRIVIRDDGSTDNTLEILQTYQAQYPQLFTIITDTHNLGAKGNFNYLFAYALKHTNSDYFLCSDQDDVWHKDKIASLLFTANKKTNNNHPLLVFSDAEVVDNKLQRIANSTLAYQQLNPDRVKLPQLLMQNPVTGCTTLFNRNLLQLAYPIAENALMHDWWLAVVASSFGEIIYLDKPLIKYRQHSDNDTGAQKRNISYYLANLKSILGQNSKQKILQHLNQAQDLYARFKDKLNMQDITVLENITNIKKYNWLYRRYLLVKYDLLPSGIWRKLWLLIAI